jgi:hypothetical protein
MARFLGVKASRFGHLVALASSFKLSFLLIIGGRKFKTAGCWKIFLMLKFRYREA